MKPKEASLTNRKVDIDLPMWNSFYCFDSALLSKELIVQVSEL